MRAKVLRKFLILAALIFLTPPAMAGFRDGVTAFKLGNYERAYQEWLPLAEGGDPSAAFNLGFMYEHGYGVPINYDNALRWYKRATSSRLGAAEYRIGMIYEYGIGVASNLMEAKMWYEEGARKKNANARAGLSRVDAKLGSTAGRATDSGCGGGGIYVYDTENATVDQSRADCVVSQHTGTLHVNKSIVGHTALTTPDLDKLRETVTALCETPSQKGHYLKIEGDLNVGATLKVVGINGGGKITKEDWRGISQTLSHYKTDPRECAIALTPILLRALTGSPQP
jgi:TPR repeat protein